MQNEQFILASAFDQTFIYGMIMTPDIPAIGIIQFVHGMAEHKERYEQVMTYFTKQGYICLIHDHRGHGTEAANRNDLGYFYDDTGWGLVEDVHQITMYIRQRNPDLPVILFGHSMGSLIVRAVCSRYDGDYQGLIVCGSPSKNAFANVGVCIAKLLRLWRGDRYRSDGIQQMLFGKFHKTFDKQEKNSWLCSDTKVVNQYNEDPACGFVFTLNGFLSLFHLMYYVYRAHNWHVKHADMPILFLSGEDDPCLVNERKFKNAHQFMKRLGYVHVSAILYEGMRHEILLERNHMLVFRDIKQWIDEIL